MGWTNGIFVRTDGSNTGPTVWQTARDSGVNILATRHDTHDEDIADGINACLARDGSNTPTADIPMQGRFHTNVGNAAATNQFCAYGQAQDNVHRYAGTSSGAANVFAVSLSPAISAYTPGLMVFFMAHQGSTSTTPTLNINSVGAKTITKMSGALVSGDIVINKMVWAIYNSTADEFQLLNPATK